jgi:CubicO group peptidase (beta-lactamase class C family)
VSGLTERTDPFFNDQPGVREAFGPTGPKTCEEAARWFVGFRMQADPGTRFAYVNMNYCLLSLVIEVVTKLPYDQAVQQLVLSRRGIHDAALGRSQEPLPREVVHLTQPADQPGGGLFMESLLGAGGWVGTSVDLVRFLDGLDPHKPGAHLIQPDLYSQLLVPATGNGSSWGLGVEVFGADTFGHTGSLAGARGMEQHRADGITWAILVNGSFPNHGAQLQSLMNGAISQITTWPSYDYGPDLP